MVCELPRLAMLKGCLLKVIQPLSAKVMQRGCPCSVLSALLRSCRRVLPALLCNRCSELSSLLYSCYPNLSALLCSCRFVLSMLLCKLLPFLVCAPQQQQQQLAWLRTKLSNGLVAQLCVWTVWLHVQRGTLMLVTAAAGKLCCWCCQSWQHWQSLSQNHWPQQQAHVHC